MEQERIIAFLNSLTEGVDFLSFDFDEEFLASIESNLDRFFPGAHMGITEGLLSLRGKGWDYEIKKTLAVLAKTDLHTVLLHLRQLADKPESRPFYLQALAELALHFDGLRKEDNERISSEYLSPLLEVITTLSEDEWSWLIIDFGYFPSESSLYGLYHIQQSVSRTSTKIEEELADSIARNLKFLN